jgi:KipI family sensor histidine kinase inhibitor
LKFSPAGDAAVSVEFGDEISLGLNTRVRALEHVLQQGATPGVVETVPAYSALLVYYDAAVIGYDALCEKLAALAGTLESAMLPPARVVELPCCYEDPELAFDLEEAAETLGMKPAELIGEHAGAAYHVYFIGFTPGLPYMVLPERLRIPRRTTPRTSLPPGSVGLGGSQCCIYSVECPGGYWIVGRTPLRLYDPEIGDPVLLEPGDTVRFRPVDRAEFDRIAAAVASHTFRPVIA